MSASYEFSIEIVEGEGEGEEKEKGEGRSRVYGAVEESDQASLERVVKLQEVLKMQNLLLEYEEKKKNERVKEIDYHYVNAYTNYLWTRFPAEKKQPFILLNQKDLLALHEDLPTQLHTLLVRLAAPEPLPFRNDLKPPPAFLTDFMNFWPRWPLRMRQVIELEVAAADRIEACFESEYTFAAKVLSSIRLNDKVQRFCAQIFEPVLGELGALGEELVVDFAGLYEKWSEGLGRLPALRRFVEGGDPEVRGLRGEIEELFGRVRGEQEAKMLLEEMVHFERKEAPIAFLMAEVGEDEVTEGLSLRLAWLVWKKILANRKRLEHLATGLLSSIIEAFASIPHEVKLVVRCFREVAEAKFGALRFQDLKSFFNKVVFSQLFFGELMSLHEGRGPSAASNTNLTLLALVSQKIMFGQQFYEKFKFGFLNQVILHYVPTIHQFIRGFVSSSIHSPPAPFRANALLSFHSLRFLHDAAVAPIHPDLVSVSQLSIAGRSFPASNVFVYLGQKINSNYGLVLRPANKIRRSFTEFLILIDKISEKSSMARLLEQYRCSEEDVQGNRPSVQLYSIYLSEIIREVDWEAMVGEIEGDLAANRLQIETIKIGLEKEYNYSTNLEKMYMRLLSQRRTAQSKRKIQDQVARLLNAPFGFDYEIVDGKVCESSTATAKTFGGCLNDICACFQGGMEGVEGLYHTLCERVVEELEKGVVPDNLAENAKSILGEKMYQIMKLDSSMGARDLALLKQMEKHAFVTPHMLDLRNFEAEIEIIVNEVQKLVQQLYRPLCPDSVLKLFYQMTLVFQNVILTTGSGTDITADIQIPLMLITMIRCRVRNMATLIDFVEKFCPDDIHSSVLGQTLTLLKSVIYLIEEMDHKKLNITKEEYDSFVVNSTYIIID